MSKTQSNRTVVYLATVAERSNAEVEHLRRELIEMRRDNQELTAQAKAYEVEVEMERRDRAAKLVIAAGTTADMRRTLQDVFDAAMTRTKDNR